MLRCLLALLSLAVTSAAQQSPMPAPQDPNLWLEDVGGERALEWVRERNAASTKELAEYAARGAAPDRGAELQPAREPRRGPVPGAR